MVMWLIYPHWANINQFIGEELIQLFIKNVLLVAIVFIVYLFVVIATADVVVWRIDRFKCKPITNIHKLL